MKEFEVHATGNVFSSLLDLAPGYQIEHKLPKTLKGGHRTQNGIYMLKQGRLVMDGCDSYINYRGLHLEPSRRSMFLRNVNGTWLDVWFGDAAYVFRDENGTLEVATIEPSRNPCSKTKRHIVGYVNGKRAFLAYAKSGYFSKFYMGFVYPHKLEEDQDFLHALVAIAWWKLGHDFGTS